MEQTDKSLQKEQARNKRNFDACLRKSRYNTPKGSFVFLRKEQGTAKESKHKLVRVATRPYQVIDVTGDTVVISRGDEHERVSRDRVELAPNPLENQQENSLKGALEALQGVGSWK